MSHNYLSATDDIRRELGRRNPICPTCGNQMSAEDDHGRFKCFSCEVFGTKRRRNPALLKKTVKEK